ncbi:MAG: twin-arginine translocase TatA/TatE family subunit [Actinomycetota bacterium]|nr:twin-arginine translocase TatA/TatE family subunit [Actinomycetota bacterium]
MLALFQSFGLPELGIILLIALIIFGPSQLPKIGSSVGKAIREFRHSSTEVSKAIQEGIEGDVDDEDEEEEEEKEKKSKKKKEKEEEED